MKFSDLFTEALDPIWEKIWEIPEFLAMKGCPQNQTWHREGDVAQHTINVVNQMSKLTLEDGITSLDTRLFLMASALCHDLGKPSTTYFDESDGEYHCKNHGQVGEKIVRKLFEDEDIFLREHVCAMVRNHMAMHQIVQKKSDFSRLGKLSYCGADVCDLIRLYICDSKGSENIETDEYVDELAKKVTREAKEMNCYNHPMPFFSWEGKYNFLNGFIPQPDNFIMYVTIGVPGSGKDYFVDNQLKKVVKISRDQIRTEIGLPGEKPMGNKQDEKKVTEIAHKRILDLCKERKSFVIADTNIHKVYRQRYTQMVMPYHPKIVYIYVNTPIDLCKERRNGQMPLEVIDNMWSNLDFPTMAECDDLIIVNGYE